MDRLTRCDTVTIKRLLHWQLLALQFSFLPNLLCLLRGSETPAALLIHLRPRRHPIHRHEEEFLRLNLAKQMIHVCEYRSKDLLF